jgi:DMSO/TMAO reductase YedYZ heme-binding membrane subunit
MILWYLARAAGIAAFAGLSLSTALGALTSRGTAGTPPSARARAVERRVVVQYAHRAAALVGVALVGLHVVTLLADPYAGVGVTGLLPFGSAYRPLAVTYGVLSLYLLVAVVVTGLLRGRMAGSATGARRWRYIHASAYLAWAASAWHFLQAGTDAGSWWARAVLFAGVGTVVCAVAARLSRPTRGVRAADGPGRGPEASPLVRDRTLTSLGASR